jgi:hypothetical protein
MAHDIAYKMPNQGLPGILHVVQNDKVMGDERWFQIKLSFPYTAPNDQSTIAVDQHR